jgi:hypothetical protein
MSAIALLCFILKNSTQVRRTSEILLIFNENSHSDDSICFHEISFYNNPKYFMHGFYHSAEELALVKKC